MLMKWTSCLFLISTITGLTAEKDRFDNYRLYTVQIDTLEQLHVIHNLEANSDGYLLWNHPVLGDSVDIMLAPHKLTEFSELTRFHEFQARLKMKNVQRFT